MMKIWGSNDDSAATECENVYSHLILMTTEAGKENIVSGYFWLILPMKQNVSCKRRRDSPTVKKRTKGNHR